jgi:hypothetical protein
MVFVAALAILPAVAFACTSEGKSAANQRSSLSSEMANPGPLAAPPESEAKVATESPPTAVVQLPSPVIESQPSAELLHDRVDCSAIRGTAYRSETEHRWFLANCNPAPAPPTVAAPSSAPPPTAVVADAAAVVEPPADPCQVGSPRKDSGFVEALRPVLLQYMPPLAELWRLPQDQNQAMALATASRDLSGALSGVAPSPTCTAIITAHSGAVVTLKALIDQLGQFQTVAPERRDAWISIVKTLGQSASATLRSLSVQTGIASPTLGPLQ